MDLNGYNLSIHEGRQGKHIKGHKNYVIGRSFLTINPNELATLYTGKDSRVIVRGVWNHKERFEHAKVIGIWISPDGETSLPTKRGLIHYSKDDEIHIVPAQPGSI